MRWTRGLVLAMLVVMVPFAVSAELVQLPSAPDNGQIPANTVYTWPGTATLTEDMVDTNAEPFFPDIRADRLNANQDEIGQGNQIDDLTQIYIDGFFPGWETNWAGPYGGGYDSGGSFHSWIWTERTERSSVGSYAAWCAGDASEVPDPGTDTYPDNMVTWMYYGPVDMSTYDGAAMEFDAFVDCEGRWDYLFAGISYDGYNFTGNYYSGYDGAWHTNLMFSDEFSGTASSVYFLFKFQSDYTGSSGEGMWIDQVRLYGDTFVRPDLRLTGFSWTPMNPASGASVDITLDYTNAGAGDAGPFYVDVFTDTDGVMPEIGQTGDIAHYNSSGLAAGASTSYSWTISYPSNGTRWLTALIDTDELVDEWNENNNTWGVEKLPVGTSTIIWAGPVTPTLVPATGGWINYDVTAYQYTATQTRPAWISIRYGTGFSVEVFQTAGPIPMVPGPPRLASPNHYIPSNAPGGHYKVNVCFGSYPWYPYDTGVTYFWKDGPVANSLRDFEGVEFQTSDLEWTEVMADDGTTMNTLPTEFAMGAAYPNPFNPATTISLALPETTELTVTVFNLQGQLVTTLASGQYPAGQHQIVFDATDLASGVYLVQATTGAGETAVQKVILMK